MAILACLKQLLAKIAITLQQLAAVARLVNCTILEDYATVSSVQKICALHEFAIKMA